MCQQWNTYASRKNCEWKQGLGTNASNPQKRPGHSRNSTPSKKIWVEENEKAWKISNWSNILHEGNTERRSSHPLKEPALDWMTATLNGWTMSVSQKRNNTQALTSVAQLVGCHPAKWKVATSNPYKGTFGFGPQSGRTRQAANQCFSLTLMFLSLSPSRPLSLKINKIFKNKRNNNQ